MKLFEVSLGLDEQIVPLFHPFFTPLLCDMNPRHCETCGAWGHRAPSCPLKRLNEMPETLGPRQTADEPGRERGLPDLRRPGLPLRGSHGPDCFLLRWVRLSTTKGRS